MIGKYELLLLRTWNMDCSMRQTTKRTYRVPAEAVCLHEVTLVTRSLKPRVFDVQGFLQEGEAPTLLLRRGSRESVKVDIYRGEASSRLY